MPDVTPFLWFEKNAEEAARFYVSLIPNSRITSASSMVVAFELNGRPYVALNGGPHYQLNEAFSLYVDCETQAEVDHFWGALLEGGRAQQCGWLKDRYGLSWQIVPNALPRLLSDPDPAKAARVQQAMMGMVKLDVAGLEAAARG